MAASPLAASAAVISKRFVSLISNGTSMAWKRRSWRSNMIPIRTARLALLQYKDGEKRLHHRSERVARSAPKLMSGPTAPPEIGNSLPLKTIPVGLPIHNIELIPGRGAQMVRTAGCAATLMSRDEGYAQIRLPSGEIRRINENCYATIGQVGNTEHENVVLGKAGRSRHRGIRPINRGVARNPVDHPNGGGAGKSKSGGGWQQLIRPGACSPRVTGLASQAAKLQPLYRRAPRWPPNETQANFSMGRSIKKGPFVDLHLLEKIDKAKDSEVENANQDLVAPLDDYA